MAHVTIDTTAPRVQYLVGGTPDDEFDIPFTFFSTADIRVYVASGELGASEFTVTGNAGTDAGFEGGKVTLNAAISNTTVTLLRDVPTGRTTDFPTSGPLQISALNTDLDKLIAILQQIEETLARAMVVSATANVASNILPDPEPSKGLAWNSAGSALVNVSALNSSSAVSSFMENVLVAPDAATARATLGETGGFRNAIINGGFDIWQRGTSQTARGYGSDDRWVNDHHGSTKTHSRQAFTLGQTDVPGNPKYFSRTVVSSVAGADNLVRKYQPIGGVRTFAGDTMALSFWAKADATRGIAVELNQYFGSGGSPSGTVSAIGVHKFSLTTSWQKFTAVMAIPSIAGKTLGTDENDYLFPTFWFDAGTTYNSRTASLGHQSGTFDIAQVQLEPGSTATPFERRPVAIEQALCDRYFERRAVNGAEILVHLGARSPNRADGQISYRAMKRVTPSATAPGNWQIYGSGTENLSLLALIPNTEYCNVVWNDTGSPFNVGDSLFLAAGEHIDFDAEL